MILIDLDGTLIDTVPDLADAGNAMQRVLSAPERSENEMRQWIGNGIERFVKRVMTGTMDGEPDPVQYEYGLRLFLELYRHVNGYYSTVYPGVIEGLDYLKKQRIPCGCITNKAERFTKPLLSKMKLKKYFKIVLSGDSLPVKKPDPLPLLHAAEFFGVSPAAAIMLGDSVNDIKAARAAGFGKIICVSYGYNHGLDIRQSEPAADAVIDSLAELPGMLG